MNVSLRYAAAVESPKSSDARLVDRIIAAYRFASRNFGSHGDSMWAALNGLNADIHAAAIAGDKEALSRFLSFPSRTDLFYGFEFLAKSLTLPQTAEERDVHGKALHRILVDLCEVTGAIHTHSPEKRNPPERDLRVETLLTKLDTALGFRVDFPNPFPFESGLSTSRGIISSRPLAALYQVWRIMTLTADVKEPRILEIGAGLGRTAYYAIKAGIRDYTIIDLPMTNIAQANFLGRVLSDADIALAGETQSAHVKIKDVNWKPDADCYDLVVNVDSLTEMDRGHAEDYVSFIKSRAKRFLSINHEANSFSVKELLGSDVATIIRGKYCLRPGYIEEIVIL